MTLLADSGSTKTTWRLVETGESLTTPGINPVRDTAQEIAISVGAARALLLSSPRHIHFYGAGCIPPFKERVEEVLAYVFHEASITVESDLLGAARSLCGHAEGIACILGTGSNSCLFDGREIVRNVSPLGYILGDEGSGAVLGRTLVGDLLKGQWGEELRRDFLAWGQFTPADIIDRVYRQPQANRFLASLVPFISLHRDALRPLLDGAFRAFFRRNVAAYGRRDLPVHFVGGVANEFVDELRQAALEEGFRVGEITKDPMEGMVEWHKQNA